MRPIRKVVAHALAATVLAAFTATSAVAADAFLKLGDIKGESTDRINNPVPRGGGKQIEIASWSWGATRKGWDGTIKGPPSAEKFGAVGGMHRDADAARTHDKASPKLAEARAAAGTETTGGAPAATPDPNSQGLAVSDPGAPGPKTTSKRQHKPVTISKPYEAGSMTFRGRVQGCAAGTTYRDATMVTRAYKYEFQDVIITSCATAGGGALPMEEVSFNYGKIVTKATTASDKTQWDLGTNKKL